MFRPTWLTKALLPIALLGGVILGFVLANVVNCTGSCSLDVALFDAVGTWVIGLGGAAISIAGFALAREARLKEKREAEAEALAIARLCTVRAEPRNVGVAPGGAEIHAYFHNKTSERVEMVAFVFKKRVLHHEKIVASGRTYGHSFDAQSLGLQFPTDPAKIQQIIRREFLMQVTFVYRIRNHFFSRTNNTVTSHGDTDYDTLIEKLTN